MLSQDGKELFLKKYRANPNFLLREIGDEYVLIPVGEAGNLNNSVISLNDTSQFLWKQFLEPTTVQEVIEKARAIYDDTENVLEKEIQEFVKAYLEVGLLEEKL